MDLTTGLLLAAVVSNAVAAGATLDQTFKQLPARHRIGAAACQAYARAADLGNGLIWYPIMGISTTLIATAAIITGLLSHPGAATTMALTLMAIGTAGFTAATAKAAPTMLTLRYGDIPESVARQTLDRFTRFNGMRAAAITLTAATATWALLTRIS